MKKYLFRLEAVLKLRKLKEENCKFELGQLILHLQKIDQQIEHDRNQVNHYYKIQEEALKMGVLGNELQAFPILLSGKEKNITLLSLDKKKQEKLINDKKNELSRLRGDLKVFEKMKEKDFEDYRKNLNKEIDQKVEEQTRNWMSSADDEV